MIEERSDFVFLSLKCSWMMSDLRINHQFINGANTELLCGLLADWNWWFVKPQWCWFISQLNTSSWITNFYCSVDLRMVSSIERSLAYPRQWFHPISAVSSHVSKTLTKALVLLRYRMCGKPWGKQWFSALDPTKTKEKHCFRPPRFVDWGVQHRSDGRNRKSKTLFFLCFWWFESWKP